MNLTAREIGEELGLEVVGEADCRLTTASSLEEAEEGSLSFIRSSKYSKWLKESSASAIIVPDNLDLPANGKAFIKSDNPYVSFAQILERYFITKPQFSGISPLALVSKSAQIGKNVSIEPFVFIGEDVKVGDNCILMSGVRIGNGTSLGKDCVLHANVVIEPKTTIGQHCIFHPGVVIGSDGFGYTQTKDGNIKLPHVGTVLIGDHVEIGSNTTIDRASLGKTVISDGTKIDNQVQLGHGVQLGKHNVLCAQSGIAGSARTGDRVILASKAGIGDHIKVGSGVTIGPMSGVVKDLPDGVTVSGFPSMPHQEWLKLTSILAQMTTLRGQIKNLLQKTQAAPVVEEMKHFPAHQDG